MALSKILEFGRMSEAHLCMIKGAFYLAIQLPSTVKISPLT
jgi:hypothetical protein